MSITYNTNGPLQKAEKLEKAAEALRDLGGDDLYDLADACEEQAQKLKVEWCKS